MKIVSANSNDATLILRYLEGAASPEEVQLLDEKLRNSAEVRRDFVALSRQIVHLQDLGQEQNVVPFCLPESPATMAPQKKRLNLSRRGLWAAVAAVVLCAAGSYMVWKRPAPAQVAEKSSAPEAPIVVCQVRQMVNARFSEKPAQLGDCLFPRVVQLEAGLLELQFTKGAVVTIEGPARIELASADKVVLHQGKVAADVPAKAVGFAVKTPVGDFVDLGTRFGVSVSSGGVTEMDVFEGKVEWAPAAGLEAERQQFVRGMAAVVDPGAGTLSVGESNPNLFPQPGEVVTGLMEDGDFETSRSAENTHASKAARVLWGGDRCETAGSMLGIAPYEGKGMLRFLRADAHPLNSRELWRMWVSERWCLIDVSWLKRSLSRKSAVVEASIYFNEAGKVASSRHRFSFAISALRGKVYKLKAVNPVVPEIVLAANNTNLVADADPNTWQCVTTTLKLPANTEVVKVKIKAQRPRSADGKEGRFTGQFADSATVQIRIPPTASTVVRR